ncbi:MAG: NAD(P)H-binding protein [Ignavibacteriae bacterium]|nr:NAD(P)H-binding protein [Ignavibacteriota bacterium]
MNILIAGASGATGKLLVEQLINSGHRVKAIVRPSGKIPSGWSVNENIEIIRANISEMSLKEMSEHLTDCDAAASCLGHNITLKGLFGKPRKLCTDAVRLICEAINRNVPENPIKFVLMNTVANRNRNLDEKESIPQKLAIGLIRLLVPPQSDNEQAAEYLRVNIGQNHTYIQWAAVRPDALTNEEKVTEYTIHESPTRSGVFNPGKTSRINTANFIARLITEDGLWNKWRGKMPVVYNKN